MHKLAALLALTSIGIGCGAGVEGVKVGEPSRANPTPIAQNPNAKIVADNGSEDTDVAIVSTALPFPIEPMDAAASQAEVEKLAKISPSFASNWVPPGQSDRWGHAAVIVNAPIAAVRSQAIDYGHIKDIAPTKFKTSRIVDKNGGLTDVYLQMPMLKGLIMLWEVVRFSPLEVIAPGHEVVHGTLVKGNVKQCKIVVTMRAIDAQRTVVSCDLLMTPAFYAPQATIDDELRDGAQNAVEGLKARAEAAR